ncbi:MFS transporter [Pseudomonas sp. PDM24]|uniref:MFS transporter n=1 Tax=Pseudomonas sp. PDM24 TaxID=2854777 RepID=UPI001C45AFD4|nr:MFS transporter [Pseudomonas sp. PDM24]MBV7495086.1 MFS transporter [Pseudomonas sp. PDM24]
MNPPTPRSTWVIMLALAIAEITSTFEVSMAFVALPTLNRVFADPAAVSWVLSSFFIVAAGSVALFARLGDLYGRRRMLMTVLSIAACGSLISALSTTLPGVILGRSLQGVTGAVLPLCLGLMRENMTPKTLTFNIGIMGGVMAVSSGLAFLVAGAIIDLYDWHGMFFFSALLAVVGMVAVWSLVPASPPVVSDGSLDILGGALFVPAVTGLMLSLTLAKSGWLQPQSAGLLMASLVLLFVWARHEYRHPDPLINVRLFADRRILLANLVFAAIGLGPMIGGAVILSLAQQPAWSGAGLGLTATAASLLKQPTTLMGFVAGPVAGLLAARYGIRVAMLVGGALVLAAWVPPLLNLNSLSALLLTVVVFSFGITVLFSATSNQVVIASPANRTSEAMGLAQVCRSTCAALGSQILATLLASSTVTPEGGGTPLPSAEAYRLAFLFLILCSATALLAAWLAPTPRERRNHPFTTLKSGQH